MHFVIHAWPGIGRGTLAGGTNFGRIIDRAMLRQVA